jgi:type I restriction enzyme S subunit
VRGIPLKHLCLTINRGSAPSYAEGHSGDALAVGQSCQRPDASFDLGLARWHAGALPEKGRLHGREILINSTGTGTLGRTALVPPDLPESPVFVDSHVTLVRADERKADARYLAYTFGLSTFQSFVEEGLSVGATKQRELNVEALRAIRVSVPERDMQARCADFLDRECERIRRLTGMLAEAPRTIQEAQRRAIDDSFAGPTTRLGFVAEVQTGFTLGGHYDGDDVMVERPYLRVANVQANTITTDDIATVIVSESVAQRTTLRGGDVLMTEGGDIDKLGRGATWDGRIPGCLHQNHVFAVRCGQRLNPAVLAIWTRGSEARQYFERTASRITNIASTNLTKLRRLPVPDMSFQDQRAQLQAYETENIRLTTLHKEFDKLGAPC